MNAKLNPDNSINSIGHNTQLIDHSNPKDIQLIQELKNQLAEQEKTIELGYQSLDFDGYFIDVNQRWLDTLGYTLEEVVGKWFGDFLTPSYRDGFRQRFPIFKAQGKIHSEFEMVHKNGQVLFIAFEGRIGYDSKGEFQQTHCILQDITEQKKFELERQIIYEITQGVTITENLNELLKLIHQSLRKKLYAENIFISLYNENTELFSFPYFVDQFDPTPHPVARRKSVTQYVFRSGKPLLMSPELFEQLKAQNEVELVGSPAPSWIGVPLLTPTRTIGVLVLQHYEKTNVYSEDDVQFLESVGSQIAIAIDRKQAEQELRTERLLLRTVIDNIPDSIYCKDLAGRKTLANRTELRFSGVKTEAEILGKTDFDLYPKELADGFFADDQVVLQTGQPVINREEFVIDSTGQKKWLLTSKIPLKDEKGNILGIIGIGRDISKRRQAEADLRESEIKLDVILQSTADGILAIDGNGKVIKTNKRFAELWQIPQALIDTRDDQALLSFVLDQLTDANEFISKVQKLYRSTDLDLDHLHFKDGRTFERFSAPLILPDSSIGRVWSFRDITSARRAEEEIQKNIQKLSDSNAEKDKFFSIIAHDLRNPLSSFLGLTKLMVDEFSQFTTEEVQDFILSMSKSATTLYRLLENLLQWSQIHRGGVPFNPEIVRLGQVVNISIEMIHESAKTKGIEIITDIPPDISAFVDSNMLQTVIRNLVSNAVKFTPRGGEVRLSVITSENNFVEVSIQDTGIGMEQTMIDNLFRLDVKTGRTGTDGEPSTGLGLLLCKEFIEMNSGKLWVESEVGKGSVFYFTIPV
jgi:PAS domain S-box-containing protein